jgi:Flp pilus assembly protein TadD
VLRRCIYWAAVWVVVTAVPCPALPTEQTTVLVFPPEGPAGRPLLGWVGEAIAHSVSEQMQAPGIKVFSYEDRQNFLEGADLPPNVPLSHASMIQVARGAGAHKLVLGSWSGTEREIRVSVRVLDVRATRLSGELSANGPLAALPEMENELAWLLLGETTVNRPFTRDQFKQRRRSVPNAAYASLARSFMTNDDNEQLTLLKRALELFPEIPEASYLVGRHHYRHGEYEEALPYLEAGQKWQTGYLDDLFMLGTCYVRKNELDSAIQSYRNLLSFARSAEALNNLGVAYLRKGDYPLAIESLVEAHNLAGQQPTIALNFAIARHLQGNDAMAEALLQQSPRSDATRGVTQYLLSLVLEGQSKKDAAKAALEKAISAGIDPQKMKADGPKGWTRLITAWDSGM